MLLPRDPASRVIYKENEYACTRVLLLKRAYEGHRTDRWQPWTRLNNNK